MELISRQPERLTDDDFETIRIHLNACKEKLCIQQRWKEAEEYQRIIDRFMTFASAHQDVPDTNAGDMISRQVAMERLMAQNVIMDGSEYHNGFNAGVNRAQEVIRNLPPVQPKRGKWIEMPYIPSHTKYMCSECGKTIYTNSEYLKEHKFCFSCGARMVEPQESEDKA